MTTKAEFITQFKADYPTLRKGDDETGYTNLTTAEYEAKISEWADNKLANETAKTAEDAIKAQFLKDRADDLAKLEAVGLTPAQARAVAQKNL